MSQQANLQARKRETERKKERKQPTNQEVHHCVCHSLFIYPQQLRLLSRCVPSAKHTQCLDVLDRSHGRCTEPWHPKQPAQPSQNANYHEVKVVASSLFEAMFSFVYKYDRELVLNKDENTHLERYVDERRRGKEERGGRSRKKGREQEEGEGEGAGGGRGEGKGRREKKREVGRWEEQKEGEGAGGGRREREVITLQGHKERETGV